jgi:hypothetical protein
MRLRKPPNSIPFQISNHIDSVDLSRIVPAFVTNGFGLAIGECIAQIDVLLISVLESTLCNAHGKKFTLNTMRMQPFKGHHSRKA